MVKAEFVLGGFEAVFDCPAMAFDGHKRLDVCPGGTPGCEESEIAVADIAADQKTAGPKARFRLIIFIGFEIGEFTVSPVMKPCALGPLASGQALPRMRRKVTRDFFRRACNRGLSCP